MAQVTLIDRVGGDVPAWLDPDAASRLAHNLAGPGPREHWKHSSLRLALETFAEAESTTPVLAVPEGAEVVRFSEVDATGLADIRAELALRMDWSRYPLADAVSLIAADGWLIDVEQVRDAPLVIEWASGINVPLLVRVAEGARLEIRESSTASSVEASLLALQLGKDARVVHSRKALNRECRHWQLHRVRLDENASYELHSHVAGARLRRLDCQFLLEGTGAAVEITGAGITSDGTHLDQQHVVEHIGRLTRSRNKLHNVAQGKSRCSFNGRIHIHDGASGTDADLQNKNLAMHSASEVNTKPELEIYNDDVRCAHGATVGQLSDDAFFYLRSRGIDELLARRLLCVGFIGECVDGPMADELRVELLEHLDA